MKEYFLKLWFNTKEYKVFLYLTEYWVSSCSEIWKHLEIPKSTINFIADHLWKRWFIKKSFRWKTGYYEVDIEAFKKLINSEILEKQNILREIIPILEEKNKNIISRPKITFIDWLDNCKKAYLELLKIKWSFYEFWSHEDLEDAFGKDFMDNFIRNRAKNNIFCNAISTKWKYEEILKMNSKTEYRNLSIFPKNSGKIYSSITMYENKVLILNLNKIFSGVIIENREFYETMKTIFNICKSKE